MIPCQESRNNKQGIFFEKLIYLIGEETPWRLVECKGPSVCISVWISCVEDHLHHNDAGNDNDFDGPKNILDLAIYSDRKEVDDKNSEETHSDPDRGVGVEAKCPL